MSRTDIHDSEFGPSVHNFRPNHSEAPSPHEYRQSMPSIYGALNPATRTPSNGEININGRDDWPQSNRRTAASPFGSFPSTTPPLPSSPPGASRASLWWGNLEPWMDEEYVKQVCSLMRWDPITIRVPPSSPDAPHANNPGFCILTFTSASHAANVLSQVSSTNVPMPNSSKPFVLNWASSVPTAATTPIPSFLPQPANQVSQPPQQQQQQQQGQQQQGQPQQYPREYSIFVGDLAPETSNSDLVAVFRNPVLGLRNDREPKFIRPFLSCKSAKIMLDPVTGVSRGYGFVRFTDEADQQRALIEMHGLYCLSRPMRISPATAKHKPAPTGPGFDLPQPPYLQQGNHTGPHQSMNLALSIPSSNSTSQSVSGPIASTSNTSVPSSNSSSSLSGGSQSLNSISSSGTSQTSAPSTSPSGFALSSAEELLGLPNNVLAQLAQQYANGPSSAGSGKPSTGVSITAPFGHDVSSQHTPTQGTAPRYMINEESWKHHAQARAILGNLIGPNGEQLTSADPYNTTVFVGGLSPLISEDTLRTFFAPFGDIHYVKVPVGKHCGFVQFVRKADAELAIDKMQGFPIGGSRIRLSWGRSQYKAAQAAAQAAQNAALQSHFAGSLGANPPTLLNPAALHPGFDQSGHPNLANIGPLPVTQEQAMQLLQKLSVQGYLGVQNANHHQDMQNGHHANIHQNGPSGFTEEKLRSTMMTHHAHREEEDKLDQYPGHYDVQPPVSSPSFSDGSSHRVQHQASRQVGRPQVPVSAFSPFSPDPATLHPQQSANTSPQGSLSQNPYSPGSGMGPPTHVLQSKRSEPSAMFGPHQPYGSHFFPSSGDAPSHRDMTSGQPSHIPSITTRPSSGAATRYGQYLDSSSYPGSGSKNAAANPISRPPSGQRPKTEIGHHPADQEHDLIQDLNGTLASLDLEGAHDDGWKKDATGSVIHNDSSSHEQSNRVTPTAAM